MRSKLSWYQQFNPVRQYETLDNTPNKMLDNTPNKIYRDRCKRAMKNPKLEKVIT